METKLCNLVKLNKISCKIVKAKPEVEQTLNKENTLNNKDQPTFSE
jgi:hypothetical protein